MLLFCHWNVTESLANSSVNDKYTDFSDKFYLLCNLLKLVRHEAHNRNYIQNLGTTPRARKIGIQSLVTVQQNITEADRNNSLKDPGKSVYFS